MNASTWQIGGDISGLKDQSANLDLWRKEDIKS